MKDQEARDRIGQLEKRLEFYESERWLRIQTGKHILIWEVVSIKQVVQLILKHLGIELGYAPYVQSKVSLKPLDTKEERD